MQLLLALNRHLIKCSSIIPYCLSIDTHKVVEKTYICCDLVKMYYEMKKSPTRTVLLGLLIAASFSSYLFLSKVAPNTEVTDEPIIYTEELEESGESVLPDLLLLKRVIEAGKQLIPAS
jgi:hypothetical protein